MESRDVVVSESQGMSTKKKWIIGCGGCLVVVVIIGIILAVLIGKGVTDFMKNSDETSKAVFGETLPEGYMTFGLPIPSKDGKVHMAMLVSKDGDTMVMAF